MAHRYNVTQVAERIPSENPEARIARVVDPWCGKEFNAEDARNFLYLSDQTLCFCSKECRGKYLEMANRVPSGTESKQAVSQVNS